MAAVTRRLATAQSGTSNVWLRGLPFPRAAIVQLPQNNITIAQLLSTAEKSQGGEAASFSVHSRLPSRACESLGPTVTPGSRLLRSSVSTRPDHTRLPLRPVYQSRQRSVYTLGPGDQDIVGQAASRRASTSTVPRLGDQMSLPSSGINTRPAPPMRAYTPPLPDPDSSSIFLTDQIAKQQRSNFHSTSLRTVATMVSQSVNKTALHPKGVEYVLPLVSLAAIGIANSLAFTEVLTMIFQAPSRAYRD
jgi:hypothetical protein